MKGYVYKINVGIFGVLFYNPKADVRVFLTDPRDNIEHESVQVACDVLNSLRPADRFVPADSDQRLWAEASVKVIGYYKSL